MYKLLLLSIQNSHSRTLTATNRNTLLSEIAEGLPCMMRQEALTLNFTGKIELKYYKQESLNYLFVSNLVNKLQKYKDDTEGTVLYSLI